MGEGMVDYRGILAGSSKRVADMIKAEADASAVAVMTAEQRRDAQRAFLEENVRPELQAAVDALAKDGVRAFISEGQGLGLSENAVSLDFVVGDIPSPLPSGYREYAGDRAIFHESNGKVDVTMEPWHHRGAPPGYKVSGSDSQEIITSAITQAIDSYTRRNK